MSGFKKQLHKASQLLNEKIMKVEGTQMDAEFNQMERKMLITHRLILDLVPRTTEYLQPNPAHRAKLNMLNTMSKIRGQTNRVGYPQTEGILGESMLRYGAQLGTESNFAYALMDMGQTWKEMANVKDSLDINVKNNFIDPLQRLHDKDLKEIGHQLRKLRGRRLNYDYTKQRKGKIPDCQIRQALEKFVETKGLVERSMFNLIENDVERVQHLLDLTEAVLDYHRKSYHLLRDLKSRLQKKINEALNTPKKKDKPNSSATTNFFSDIIGFSSSSSLQHSEDLHFDQPCCRARYSFNTKHEGELAFKKGDIVILTSRVNGNWYEGMLSGEIGIFPVNHVEIIIPLPQ